MALDTPILFAATTDGDKSRDFYERVLGLTFEGDQGFALVFRVGNLQLRIQRVESRPQIPYTVLGWSVPDIHSEMRRLTKAGVVFARYEGLAQDKDGMWLSPAGARVAWFADPDANILSLTQHEARR